MEIESFDWDEENAGHVARHGLVPDQLEDLVDGRYVVLRNKRDGAGEFRIIGRDRGGRLVTVVIVSTSNPRVWRPVTAWYSNAAEQQRARNAGV